MSNFIGMVFATLKKEGIDTSKMDTSEAIAKYNELKGGEGGSNAKGEETPKQEESEQAFEASVDFWQKQLKCDRETAMKIVAKDRG